LVRAQRSDGIQSRQTILHAAAMLATVEGLGGLSIGKLAEHVGMSKSGLYAHFTSKEELQLATIETARDIFEDTVIRPTLSIEDPLDRFEAICDGYLRHVEDRVFPGGCFYAAVAAEFDTHPGPVRSQIMELIEEWSATLTGLLTQAHEKGLLGANEDPAQIAFECNSYLLLANMTFVMRNDPVVFERARRALRFRLDCALRQNKT
jgi:AcrR family transcriptional regulator